MKKGYTDTRRKDRLGERSIRLSNKELVKKLDTYCLLTNRKITNYVEDAVRNKLMFDIDNLQTEYKQEKELENE